MGVTGLVIVVELCQVCANCTSYDCWASTVAMLECQVGER